MLYLSASHMTCLDDDFGNHFLVSIRLSEMVTIYLNMVEIIYYNQYNLWPNHPA